MAKIDFKKEFKQLFGAPHGEVVLVDVPEMHFLTVDGVGDPNTVPAFKEGIELLYSISFTLKFTLKKTDPDLDYVVPPLEGLWWADDMSAFELLNKDAWKWTLMIMQPRQVNRELVQQAIEHLSAKKKQPSSQTVGFASYAEGLSAQTMHIGPYCEERPTIERLHAFIQENGYTFNGKHHEIYLGDPRRTKPERLKTVLRQPVVKR